MKNMFLIVVQIWNKFLNFVDNQSLRSKRIFIMRIMKLLWIFQVSLKDTSI